MSVLNKLPYTKMIINSLSQFQDDANTGIGYLENLVGMMDRDEAPVFKSYINGDSFYDAPEGEHQQVVRYCVLEVENKVFTGYVLCFEEDTISYMFAFNNGSQEMTILELDDEDKTYKIIDEELSIAEFRGIIDYYILSGNSGSSPAPESTKGFIEVSIKFIKGENGYVELVSKYYEEINTFLGGLSEALSSLGGASVTVTSSSDFNTIISALPFNSAALVASFSVTNQSYNFVNARLETYTIGEDAEPKVNNILCDGYMGYGIVATNSGNITLANVLEGIASSVTEIVGEIKFNGVEFDD